VTPARGLAVAAALVFAAVVARLADRDDAVVDLRWPAYVGAGHCLILAATAASSLRARRVPSGA
jgi:hypothetical protein